MQSLKSAGVGFGFLTLHVGTDTFRPIRGESLVEHQMHSEWAEVPAAVVDQIKTTRQRAGRVVAVGTTTVRALESAALESAGGWQGWTDLFIRPGFQFCYVDALLTNFHLPRSTLLVLVSAFAGRSRILAAYREAVRQRYRFFSFGDAMLLH
jgi:S-adenosylmethionine:tRNA ribosyltransferase-isomerase